MRLLDAFCGEGGSSAGYANAGFDVIGVDLFEDCAQARYPFPSIKADAVEFIRQHGHEFDAIHAGPPCQFYSAGTRGIDRADYPDLVDATRAALADVGVPWVIENVKGAPLRAPMLLCGSMFGMQVLDEDNVPLRLERHRFFEASFLLLAPSGCLHDPSVQVAGVYDGARRRRPGETAAEHRESCRTVRKGGYVPDSEAVRADLMGIDWMTLRGITQAVPPTYTAWIGAQLIHHVGPPANARSHLRLA